VTLCDAGPLFALVWPKGIAMLPEITQTILNAKSAKGLTFAELAGAVGCHPVWLAAVCYRQVNQSFVVLLASHFQGFCRDLHSENIEFLVNLTVPPYLRPIVRANLLWRRNLDRGNANFDNIAEDFNRLLIDFRTEIEPHDPQPRPLRGALQELNDWRNAIAHQDFRKIGGSARLQLGRIRRWRKVCTRLAVVFDTVMHQYLQKLTGVSPW